MKFEIVKELLLKKLSDLNSIVDRKTTQPILSHVYLEADNNQLFLMATDSEVTLQSKIKTNVIESGRITLPCDKFFQIVQRLNNQDLITCTVSEGQFHIQSGKSKFNFSTLPAEDFPIAQNVNHSNHFQLDASILFNLFNKVRFSIPNQDARQYLNGLFLNVIDEGNKIDAVTSDGHRLSCAQANFLTDVDPNIHFIVPEKAVNELVKHLNVDTTILEKQLNKKFSESVDEMNALTQDIEQLKDIRKKTAQQQADTFPRPVNLYLSEYELKVCIGESIFITRLLEGNYPAYDQIILPTENTPILINREDLLSALKRSKVLLIDRHDGIRLKFTGHQLYINARNIENETSEEIIDIVNNSNTQLETSLNINYLLDALTNIEGENVQLHFDGSEGPSLITSKEDANIRYVIMPMRL